MTIKAINVRNQFKGTVKEIIEGPVLSEIDVQTAAGIVTSVITTRSVKELELAIGSEVIASSPPRYPSPSCDAGCAALAAARGRGPRWDPAFFRRVSARPAGGDGWRGSLWSGRQGE